MAYSLCTCAIANVIYVVYHRISCQPITMIVNIEYLCLLFNWDKGERFQNWRHIFNLFQKTVYFQQISKAVRIRYTQTNGYTNPFKILDNTELKMPKMMYNFFRFNPLQTFSALIIQRPEGVNNSKTTYSQHVFTKNGWKNIEHQQGATNRR